MRLRLDDTLCTGHGRCYALCPEHFGEDQAGHAVLIEAQVPPDRIDRARNAVANCPEQAITLED